ncbi:site-specific integrase [Actinocrispum sp. NPDC049592]|uniref:tyrosine-type recombinase/integrase n=1 Tax=Actinocrispum sp. NPDC049592 TaxID=3154835 RepID=UPI00342A9E31
MVTLIDDYRRGHVRPEHPLLLPRENGRPLDRHTVTWLINKAAASAGLGHIHPHQLRHTLATQAINRGMSLEAIAALLGHHSLDITLRYAKIANLCRSKTRLAWSDQQTGGVHATQPGMTRRRQRTCVSSTRNHPTAAVSHQARVVRLRPEQEVPQHQPPRDHQVPAHVSRVSTRY